MSGAILRLLLAGGLVSIIGSVMAADLAAAELELATCDDFLRNGLPFRCLVRRTVTSDEFTQGPFLVQVAIRQGGSVLAEQEFPLAILGQLREGLRLSLIPAAPLGERAEQPASLHVTLTNPERTRVERIDRPLTTPRSLQRALEARAAAFAAHPRNHDPLPSLWLEQAGERITDGPSIATCLALADLDRRLGAWLAGTAPPPGGEDLRAFRDPVDGSAQPLRVQMPIGTAAVPVVLVCGGETDPAPRKSTWPALPAAWRQAALDAGVAVVEAYPAGDLGWDGVAPRRALLALAAAMAEEPRIRGQRVAVLGSGRGAAGAIHLAENHPGRFTALLLVDPQLPLSEEAPGDPLRRWQALHRAGERPGNLAGLAVAISGAADPAVLAWRARSERAGCTMIGDFRRPDAPAFWNAAVRELTSTMPREFVALEPGRWGRVVIDELEQWGELGVAHWDDPTHLRSTNIARLRISDGAGVQVDGRTYAEPAVDARKPRKVFGQVTGPLVGYADGPFVIVVGTGESAAALEENRALAANFRMAWARHAHGAAPLIDDAAFRPLDFPRHHLVLVGNSASNRVLRTLIDAGLTLPVRWDAREVVVGDTRFPRHQRRALALAWPHPACDGRLLVMLDGRPAWNQRAGLPLQGLPDLVVGGANDGDAPAIWQLFDNQWK